MLSANLEEFTDAAVAIAAGGVLAARRVAETMSKRITKMNPGQGATSNFVTAAIVLGASRLGLPVSTTHVSCGTIIGIGAVTTFDELVEAVGTKYHVYVLDYGLLV